MQVKIAICPNVKCRTPVVPDEEGRHSTCGTYVYFLESEEDIRRWVPIPPFLLPVKASGNGCHPIPSFNDDEA